MWQSFAILLKKYFVYIIFFYIFINVIIIFYFLRYAPYLQKSFVAFLNVGQADATFIKSGDINILIDTGSNFKILDKELSKFLPVWNRKIDLLILTHDDKDHVGASGELINYYNVSHVIVPAAESEFFESLKNKLYKKGIKITEAYRSVAINFSDRPVYLIFYYPFLKAPTKDNNSSLFFKFIDGSFTVLFLGDLPSAIEKELLRYDKNKYKTDIFKLSHHGSKKSNYKSLLYYSQAKIFVASAGKSNKYNHPDPDLQLFIKNILRKPLYITYNGSVVIEYKRESSDFLIKIKK